MTQQKAAAILAFVIGAMAIFSGGQVVLLGKEQDYYVIGWLPYYNFTMGLISAFVTSVLLWKNAPLGRTLALLTFAAHGGVLAILLLFYGDVVAGESLRAMTLRTATWAVILALVYRPRGGPCSGRAG